MKTKILPLLLMVMFAFSMAQPIFASNPKLEDTKIASKNGQPLADITVDAGEPIELQARLYWYWTTVDSSKPEWIPQICRYLDFYVYKANDDGTNGDLVWSDSAMTNFFTANANPDEFTLNEKGSYKLFVNYDGKLKPCNATAKINVV
jgi:hypothetical protein